MPTEEPPPQKDAPKKFRPRKKPIPRDAPFCQEKLPSEPTPVTESMIEALKPKVDIKIAKKTEPRNELLDILEVLVLGYRYAQENCTIESTHLATLISSKQPTQSTIRLTDISNAR